MLRRFPRGYRNLTCQCVNDVDSFDFSGIASHPRAERTDAPLFMVCTHGNHDKCCAKFGIPVFREAEEDCWRSGVAVLAYRGRPVRGKRYLSPAWHLLRARTHRAMCRPSSMPTIVATFSWRNTAGDAAIRKQCRSASTSYGSYPAASVLRDFTFESGAWGRPGRCVSAARRMASMK